jgi:prolipoprotein diacylglyceryltransferase
MFSIYLILNGIERFFIEKIRVNIKYEILGLKVTQAEIIATVLIILGITGTIYFTYRNRQKKTPT